MKTCRRQTAAVLLFVLAASSAVFAQAKRPMTLVDVLSVPRLLDPQLSPDGRSLVYLLAQPDWKTSRRALHVWRQDVGAPAPIQLTFGDSPETAPRWSPDGKTILFLARRGDNPDTQIYLLPADGGEARQLTHHATSVSSPAWSPDGSQVYFVAADPKTAEEKARDRDKDDVYAFEENYKQRHLWRVVVSTGAEDRLTDGGASVLGYRVSHDGRQIVLERAPSPLAGDAWRGEVWVMDAGGRSTRVLTHDNVEESEASLSPDGSQVLFLADASPELEPYYNTNLFVMPSAGGTPRALVADFPYAVDHAEWAPDGKSVLAVVNMGVHSEIFQIDLSGRTKQLTDGAHSIQFWSVDAPAGRMIFQIDEPTRLGDAWTLPLDGGAPTRVTGVYDAYRRDFELTREEKVEWKGADGTTIEGLLCYPIGYERGKKYPLVVQMHGGPQESDKFGFGLGFTSDYVEVLTARGYAVLKPNYRGSTGYGNAFLRDVVGGYFKNMHLDVLAGVDFLIKEGIADPDRLAAMGWSAGGHLTNKLVTFTDRFKAASSGAGAADWISMYAQTDIRSNRAIWFGGTPWQKNAPFDVYWEASPIKYAAGVKTPTLFFVGENDPRVPMPQAVEMYRALKSNGVQTRLYVAPREGHQWGELRHSLFKANAELDWFERHVMGRAYTWEKAPN